MKTTKVQEIEETNYGVYVWYTQDNKIIKNEDGDVLSVPSMKGDLTRINALKTVAHDYMKQMGAEPGGRAVFLAGRRQITDEQYEEQKARAAMGLTPDPFDFRAMEEEVRYNQRFNRK